MCKVLIVCKSITEAQKIMNLITKSGFWCDIHRTPSDISIKSCSYSVIIYEKNFENISKILKQRNFNIIDLFIYKNNMYQKIGGDFS